MESDFLPTDFVNCTGLRMCLAGGTGNAPAALGAEHQRAKSMPRTTSMKARWNSTSRCSRTCRGSRTSRPTWQAAGPSIRPSMRSNPGRSDSTGRSSIRCGSAARCRRTSVRRTSTTCSSRPASPRRSYTDRLTGGSAQGMRLASRGNPLLTPEDGEDVHGGNRADAQLHAALQPGGRLLRDPADERDHQPQLCRTTPSRPSAWPARLPTTRRSAIWRCARSPIRPILTT